ncbi:MAG: hypothetical protein HYS08_10005 [Chlamydiae bacterium]|nr:hypothetical protein [Chlamydiota bacterium]MBI3267019.1 hypothetical protein [Chlamydiota bacterium]
MDFAEKKYLLAFAFLIAALSCFSTWHTFFSKSGPVVVDYWAFAAGVLLVSDGVAGMLRSKQDTFRIQFFRLLRISIGISIFTIHTLQFFRDGRLGG